MAEEVVWKGGLAPASLYWYWLIGGFLTITFIFAIFGIPILILGVLKMNRWKYEVTSERIKVKYGFLSTTKREADLDKIQDIIIKQGMVGKLLNYGTLYFNTAGSTGYELVFSNVSSPDDLKEKFREMKNKNKSG
ncbi:MAG: PH domain-containing protein [Candidatus Altiarchaeota archaeon]